MGKLAAVYGAAVHPLAFAWANPPREQLARSLEERRQTSCCSSIETSTGVVADIEALAAVAKRQRACRSRCGPSSVRAARNRCVGLDVVSPALRRADDATGLAFVRFACSLGAVRASDVTALLLRLAPLPKSFELLGTRSRRPCDRRRLDVALGMILDDVSRARSRVMRLSARVP